MICTACGNDNPRGAKFCQECGGRLSEEQKGGAVNLGDIGVMRGTIDASVHHTTNIGQQTNIGGDVHINLSNAPAAPSAGDLLRRGLVALATFAYEDALAQFRAAIAQEPALAQAHYLAALASLKGRRPKITLRAQVEAIEQELRTACNLDRTQAHFYLLWAWIKHDFYAANGFLVRPPSVNELVESASRCRLDRQALAEMLDHSSARGSVIEKIIFGE